VCCAVDLLNPGSEANIFMSLWSEGVTGTRYRRHRRKEKFYGAR
jgi:hypothetical protein